MGLCIMAKKAVCGVLFIFMFAFLCNRSLLMADVLAIDLEPRVTEQDSGFCESLKVVVGWLGIPLIVAGIVLWIYLKPFSNKIEILVEGKRLYNGNDFDEAERVVREYFGQRGINPQVFGR